MSRRFYPLRIAAATAMFLCLICVLAQGRHSTPLLLVGQIVFGLAALVLVIVYLMLSSRPAQS
jgi:hypothetical protein